jgi:tetratricopeptide (TPR) repeat protein
MKVSRFTPSLMKHEDLEEIFVQRHKLAQNIVELIRDSAITPSKHHTLLIGPRGIGKTHLVSLVYYRIREMDDLGDRLLIAWLREEEWGITSFLDLLLRIFRALQEGSEGRGARLCVPTERVESLYELSPDAAERAGAELLKEVIGDSPSGDSSASRTLLLLMENLDEIFVGLGDEGQKRLRAFLQENTCCTILATSQSLFNGVKRQTSPFYGFFRIHHLEDLTSEEATQLLANIARLEGDRELESFIQMPTGRDRIRAVHHLASGSHRVYVIFSEFLTRESLDELVEAFMQTLDDLTPYYQARMSCLSPQQRKIIEFLCDRRHPIPVKEIAQRCFMTHQTASGQLKDLREKGYVTSEAIGRESYYELREPLMRFCLEVKKQRGEPIRLFVDFLRLWYTPTELQQRLELLPPDAALEREYLLQALQVKEKESEDPREATYWKEYDAATDKNEPALALQAAEKLIAIDNCAEYWLLQAGCLYDLENYDEALTSFEKAIQLNPSHAIAFICRGQALEKLGRLEEALVSYEKGIELDLANANFWYSKSFVLYNLKRYEEALASYNKAIELGLNNTQVWYARGLVLDELERYEDALASYNNAIELNLDSTVYWTKRAVTLSKMGYHDEALSSLEQAIQLNPNSPVISIAWRLRGTLLAQMKRYQEGLVSLEKAVEIDPNYALAWNQRGWVLGQLKHYNEALASIDKAIELNRTEPEVWFDRGSILGEIGRYEEALTSFENAITLGDQSSVVFFNRAEYLLALNRWDEGIVALDDALNRFAYADEPDIGDTEGITRNLFNSTNDAMSWRSRITTLIALYDKHQVISALGKGLVRSIPALMSEMVSDKAAQTWLDVWRELTSDYTQFQIPLRLVNAAVRYRETKGDKRVLLELPIEERSLLKPLLDIYEVEP